MQFHGPDKKESRKAVVTKICFYGKTKQKMEVGTTKTQNVGSGKKEIRKDITIKI